MQYWQLLGNIYIYICLLRNLISFPPFFFFFAKNFKTSIDWLSDRFLEKNLTNWSIRLLDRFSWNRKLFYYKEISRIPKILLYWKFKILRFLKYFQSVKSLLSNSSCLYSEVFVIKDIVIKQILLMGNKHASLFESRAKND